MASGIRQALMAKQLLAGKKTETLFFALALFAVSWATGDFYKLLDVSFLKFTSWISLLAACLFSIKFFYLLFKRQD